MLSYATEIEKRTANERKMGAVATSSTMESGSSSFCFESRKNTSMRTREQKEFGLPQERMGMTNGNLSSIWWFIWTPKKPQPKPTIIFRGTGKRISKLERDSNDKNVIVMFQPNAWADTDLCQKWVSDCLPKLVTVQEENSLFCDNLGGQTSLPF